tara:strand:- start:631 stop:1362 length:732 start_codon:yes stop_codon:yes gene_type:complete
VSSRRTTEEERQRDNPLQFFRTPPWATWAAVKWQQHSLRGARILELGAGDGRIAAEIISCAPLKMKGYVAVEKDPGRAQMLREKIEPLGGTVIEGDALTLDIEALGTFDVVIMNPPFDKAHEFLLASRRYLCHGGQVLMLQRCTYPGESKTDRDKLFKHDNPVGISLGFYAELTLTNRVDFMGDGKADSVNHSWFAFRPGIRNKSSKATREHVRRAACPWDANRQPELPRQKWEKTEKQQSLL